MELEPFGEKYRVGIDAAKTGAFQATRTVVPEEDATGETPPFLWKRLLGF